MQHEKLIICLPKSPRGLKGRQLLRDLAHRLTQKEGTLVTMGEVVIRGAELVDVMHRATKKKRKA